MFETINKFNEGAKKVRELALADMVRDLNPETINFVGLVATIKFADAAIELIAKQAEVINQMNERLAALDTKIQITNCIVKEEES